MVWVLIVQFITFNPEVGYVNNGDPIQYGAYKDHAECKVVSMELDKNSDQDNWAYSVCLPIDVRGPMV